MNMHAAERIRAVRGGGEAQAEGGPPRGAYERLCGRARLPSIATLVVYSLTPHSRQPSPTLANPSPSGAARLDQLAFDDVANRLAEQWKALSEAEKQVLAPVAGSCERA